MINFFLASKAAIQNIHVLSACEIAERVMITGFIHAYELMLGLHVFRQTGPPRRVDCLAPPSVCHTKTEASR